jgi:hypothetical protein
MENDYYLDKTFTSSAGYPGKDKLIKNAKLVAFWADGQDVSKLIVPGWNETDEAKKVLRYIENSHKIESYRGEATDRIDKTTELGNSDMLTPDFKWIFPEKHEHYINKYSVRIDNEEFIKDALIWCAKLDLTLQRADSVLSSVVNQTLLERQGRLFRYRYLCSVPKAYGNLHGYKTNLKNLLNFLETVEGEVVQEEFTLYQRITLTGNKEIIEYLFRYNHPLLRTMRLGYEVI